MLTTQLFLLIKSCGLDGTRNSYYIVALWFRKWIMRL